MGLVADLDAAGGLSLEFWDGFVDNNCHILCVP
jgi:hypothetical protein